MAFQIRTLFADDTDMLKGTVEIDEAYLGWKKDRQTWVKKRSIKALKLK